MTRSRTFSLGLAAALTLLAADAAASAGKKDGGTPTTRRLVKGVYEIKLGDDVIGKESFTERVLSNNTIVYTCEYEVRRVGRVGGRLGAALAGETRLEADEDSRFPRSYYTKKVEKTEKEERVEELEAELFANVLVSRRKSGDGTESTTTVVLPTGSLLVEQNIAHQLAVLVDRYRVSDGGKQAFNAFEPSMGRTLPAAVEYIGPAPATESGDKSGLEHYKFYVGNSPGGDLYVDAESRIIRRVVTFQKVLYELTSLEIQGDE